MFKLFDEIYIHDISSDYNMVVNPFISDPIINYIQSFIYSFEAAYDSSHEAIDDLIVFYYGQEFIHSPSEIVPFQSIVFAPHKSPEEIHRIIKSYPFKGNGTYAINEFHEDINPQNIIVRYKQLGYEYLLPNILQMIRLPARINSIDVSIQTPNDVEEADFINATFKTFKPFPKKIIGKRGIDALYATIDQKVVGWGYLVRGSINTAYVAGLFILPEYRRKGIATALLDEMHNLAHTEGARQILLAPSFMAWNFYTQRGYETIMHFSTFQATENTNPNAKKQAQKYAT